MKQDIQNDMNLVNTNADQMPVFVIIKKVGIMKNVDVNVKELIDKGICDKEFI